MKKFLKIAYNAVITLLAIFSIILVFLDFSSKLDLSVYPWVLVDNIILIIFTIDYITRFLMSKEKRKFLKENIFDLIAIIPVNQALSLFRFARLFRIARLTRLSRLAKGLRIFRAFGFLGILKKRFDQFLHTNGFIYVLYSACFLILASSFAMSLIENKTSETPFGGVL